ncbi:hypothetical protein K488DRAFT_82236 [Vararia minispora EC-137]|uniref:Uncharacterized protein n=1 Tax=Vararia minispora EC-137 TaxID=1314806 RepID=A0ACB8QWT1_9AGAM|nr:hypothetical protein K488DRAFT_82236 [Vararia minispora EC-137]
MKALVASEDRVPNEILLLIWTIALSSIEDQSPSLPIFKLPLRISLVCRRWRMLAIASPELWTHIRLDWRQDLVLLYIQRSGNFHLLSLYFNEEDITHDDTRGLGASNKFDPTYSDSSDDDWDMGSEDSDGIPDLSIRATMETLSEAEDALSEYGFDADALLTSEEELEEDDDAVSDDYKAEKYASCALLSPDVRSTGLAALYNVDIVARTRSFHLVRSCLSSSNTSRYFTVDFVPDVIRSNLRCLSLQGVAVSDMTKMMFCPSLISLDLSSVFFHHYTRDPTNVFLTLLNELSSLQSLTLKNVQVEMSLLEHSQLVSLPHLKNLDISLPLETTRQFFELVTFPATAALVCTPREIGSIGQEDLYTGLASWVPDIMKHYNLPSAHFQALAIRSVRRGCEYTFSDPSDPLELAPSLTFFFDDPSAPDFQIKLTTFVPRTIPYFLACASIKRLVVNSSELVQSDNSDVLDALFISLPAVESIDIHVAPAASLVSALTRKGPRMPRLARIAIFNHDVGKLTRELPAVQVETLGSPTGLEVR